MCTGYRPPILGVVVLAGVAAVCGAAAVIGVVGFWVARGQSVGWALLFGSAGVMFTFGALLCSWWCADLFWQRAYLDDERLQVRTLRKGTSVIPLSEVRNVREDDDGGLNIHLKSGGTVMLAQMRGLRPDRQLRLSDDLR